MAKNTEPGALIFPAEKRAQFLGPKPMIPDNWLRLRLYPIAKKLGLPFHPSSQVLRPSFSTHGKADSHPTDMQAQLGHSDARTTLEIYTRTLGPEVFSMVNQGANRILKANSDSGGTIQ
jgi:integrase